MTAAHWTGEMALEKVCDDPYGLRYSLIAADRVATNPPLDANTLEKLPTTKSTRPSIPCKPSAPAPPGPVASWHR